MRLRHFALAKLAPPLLSLSFSGCATSDEWATWRPSHSFRLGRSMGSRFVTARHATRDPRTSLSPATRVGGAGPCHGGEVSGGGPRKSLYVKRALPLLLPVLIVPPCSPSWAAPSGRLSQASAPRQPGCQVGGAGASARARFIESPAAALHRPRRLPRPLSRRPGSGASEDFPTRPLEDIHFTSTRRPSDPTPPGSSTPTRVLR